MGRKSTRVAQWKCTSRWACTAAAAPWTPSFLYAFAARLPTVLIEIPNSNAIIFERRRSRHTTPRKLEQAVDLLDNDAVDPDFTVPGQAPVGTAVSNSAEHDRFFPITCG